MREVGPAKQRASLFGLLGPDVRRGLCVGLLAALPLALFEYIATLVALEGQVAAGAALQLAGLDLALFAFASLLTALGCATYALGARLGLAAWSPDAARRWPGAFVARVPGDAPSPRAAWVWAGPLAVALYVAASTWLTLTLSARFNAPALVAVLLAFGQLILLAVLATAAAVSARGFAALGRRLHPHLGRLNPFGHVVPAALALLALATPVVWVALARLRQVRELVPARHLVLFVLFLLLARVVGRRLAEPPRTTRVALVGLALLVAVGLGLLPGYPYAKDLALRGSPPLATLVDAARLLSDLDGDGHGSLLGENDCAPTDPAIHPTAQDIPDNGVDENCNGRDFSTSDIADDTQPRLPVPPRHRKPWNILLVTIDTVRYDHTGFGGYARETTPNLDRFVKRSTSFTFANAPAPGTMASIPSLLISRFFHSGVALIEHGKGAPLPVTLHESNVLLPEVLKRGDYETGAILTHRYFEMGQRQGFDHYDNKLKRGGAKGTTSPQVTDKALKWIGERGNRKWFLWVHYLDPHGDYVAHEGEKSFGKKPMDLYDAEIRFTDKHLGRLLAGLDQLDAADRTLVVLTSDHGDGFREHGFINHGMALYRELLHVPLVFRIPGLPGRTVDGATSPMDILPTLADLAGIDISDLTLEGRSLVPQLFHGWDAHHRVVYSETNYRRTLRAAVTSRHKLIHDLKAHTYELYDLEADPWEKTNLWGKPEAKAASGLMRGHLEGWLERVFYARDPATNQAAFKRSKYLLAKAPTPQHPLDVTVHDGAMKLVGWDLVTESPSRGRNVEVVLYVQALRETGESYRARLAPSMGSERGKKARTVRIGGALFDGPRWRPGEYIRQTLSAFVPASWSGDSMSLGVALSTGAGKKPIGAPVPLGKVALATLEGAREPVEIRAERAGGIEGTYYRGMKFQEQVLRRVDRGIRISSRGAVAPGMPKDKFSVRWTGFLRIPEDGDHVLCVESDDGARLFLGDELITGDWSNHSKRRSCAPVTALAGWHPLRVEYYDKGSSAYLRLLRGRTEKRVRPVGPRDLCCKRP